MRVSADRDPLPGIRGDPAAARVGADGFAPEPPARSPMARPAVFPRGAGGPAAHHSAMKAPIMMVQSTAFSALMSNIAFKFNEFSRIPSPPQFALSSSHNDKIKEFSVNSACKLLSQHTNLSYRMWETGQRGKAGIPATGAVTILQPAERRTETREGPMAKQERCRAKQHTAHARSLLKLVENADLEAIDPAAIHDVIGAAGRLLDEALAPVGDAVRHPQPVHFIRRDNAVQYLPIGPSDKDGS